MINGFKKIIFLLMLISINVLADDTSYVIFNDSPSDSQAEKEIIKDALKSLVISETLELDKSSLEKCVEDSSCFALIKETYPNVKILKYDLIQQNDFKYLILSLWDQKDRVMLGSKTLECLDCSVFNLVERMATIDTSKLAQLDDSEIYLIFRDGLDYQYNQDIFIPEKYFTININPKPRAKVKINNLDYGLSPIEISSAKKDKINLELSQDSFETYNSILTFGKKKEVKVSLEAIVANLVLNSNPTRANVFINGSKRTSGRTPFTKKNITLDETLRIKLSKENYLDEEFTFSPTKKGSNPLTVNLQRGEGFLRILHEVDSSKVTLTLNGKYFGKLNGGKFNNNTATLNAGVHTLILTYEADEKVVREEKITINIMETTDWKVEFMDKADITISF
jgi:hypothetical protein